MQENAIASYDKPDIVLIKPWDKQAVSENYAVQDALGIGYLSAVLRKNNYSVLVIDAHSLDLDDYSIVECIKFLQPKIVGISLHSFYDYKHSATISDGISKITPGIYCIWGGEHASFNAEKILTKHNPVDAVVIGEGEFTFLDLVNRYLNGTTENILGAMYRDEQRNIVFFGYRPAINNLDILPFPHKDIIESAIRNEKKFALSILTGRGCTNNCKFCTAHKFLRMGGGKVWRRRSPKSVADEIEVLCSSYLGNPHAQPILHFQDVIFLGTTPGSKKWLYTYLDEIEKRKLIVPFYCMVRVDAILYNEDIIPRLIQDGLISVEIGIESGVDRILKLYNKNNNSESNQKAIELLRKNGLTYDASGFIMFDPYMNLGELRINAKHLYSFGAATWNFFISRLQLYPGTEILEEMIKNHLFDPSAEIDVTSDYHFLDPKVELVAKYAYIYDPCIVELDKALRSAKAIIAWNVRNNQQNIEVLSKYVALVQNLYYSYFLELINHAALGDLDEEFPALVNKFLVNTAYILNHFKDLAKT